MPHNNTIDVENPDDYIMIERQRADGAPSHHKKKKKPKSSLQIESPSTQIPDSDYVLVEHAAAMSLTERYGTHFLLWLGFSTALWGAIFVVLLSIGLQSKKQFDTTLVVCIPMLMVWALASMWSAYKNRRYCQAWVLSFLPILILIAILVWWYVPI
jgi:hypothetical protein